MPELPEVETTLRGIVPHIEQQKIIKVTVRHSRLRWPIPRNIHNILVGQKFIRIIRRGKYLLLKTKQGTLLIHLGMSGHLKIVAQNTLPNKHDHVDILLANKKILRFTDPRRFGAFLWIDQDPEEFPLIKSLGIEPLTKEFSGKYLFLQAQKKKTSIKSFIMNHKVVTGIGNIYATESLFAARIHPATPVHLLTIDHLNGLVKAIKTILRNAIKQGGTTLKDFLTSEGKPGYFVHQLKVYGREGLPCIICQTPLQTMRIAQRSTVYCERCQQNCSPQSKGFKN